MNLDPLLAPEVTSSPVARACLSSLLTVNLLLAGVVFLLLLYSQVVLGHGAIQSALMILPLSIAIVASAVASSVLVRFFSPRALVGGAMVLGATGSLLLAAAVSNEGGGPMLWLSEIVIGLGLGIAFPVCDSVLLASAPRKLSGDVGSARAVATFMGSAIGTAAAGAVLLSALASNANARVAEHPELVLPATIELSPTTVSFVSNDQLKTVLSKPPWKLNAIQKKEAIRINVEARLVALRSSIAVLGLLMLGGLLGIWFLPSNVNDRAKSEAEAGPPDAAGLVTTS